MRGSSRMGNKNPLHLRRSSREHSDKPGRRNPTPLRFDVTSDNREWQRSRHGCGSMRPRSELPRERIKCWRMVEFIKRVFPYSCLMRGATNNTRGACAPRNKKTPLFRAGFIENTLTKLYDDGTTTEKVHLNQPTQSLSAREQATDTVACSERK